ncbi:hypothetical protein [Ochrobactrum chromiisoli]|uniref:Peptidase n=1 Tax=Ochrobactrum chromiisoli TaxID=2993941 RepID=A0ABT3QN78_9HYPH|nr:hypothetical protein [Ochrobactrum chromiisoli]MCX2697066.1 hypothetical protein [Ochrobactrum chromiisoli]
MPAKSQTARIEVFRSGTFTSMQGAALNYSAADLKAVADNYDYDTAPAPIVVGHPNIDAPAYGWVKSFDYDASADRLFANLIDINPEFAAEVKKGSYKKVSLSFFRPDNAANPVPDVWYPKHVGFLGGAAPAVTGLKNVQFGAEGDDAVFAADFGERGFEETASLLRMMRDFFIEKFGLEEADKALPAYRIEWLGEMTIDPPRTSFAAPQPPPKPQETIVSKPDEAAFAARDANLTAREKRLADRERELAHEDNVSFAENLAKEGKLLPANTDKLVALLDALPENVTVSFAAGETGVSIADGIRALLQEQPKAVTFGATTLGSGPGDGASRGDASFAADGKSVDANQLEIHDKALAYQRQHPGTDYLIAVRAVS